MGLGFFDRDLRYMRLNKAFATINDLSVEAHIGRHASEINPRLANIFVPMMVQVLASRQPLLNIEIMGSTPGDFTRPRTWMANFYPVTNAKTFGVSVAFQDITALKATEDIRARLGVIVESSDDAIVSMTLDSTITTWNGAAERMFGYSAEEAIGKTIAILATPHRPTELLTILESLQQGERAEQHETVQRRKDGRPIDVSLTVSPIRDRHGCIIGFSETARDMTEQTRARAMLLRSNEEFRQFAFAAAHDLQELVDNYIHGAVVTIAIDKRIGTVFGTSRKEANVFIENHLAAMDLGHWKGSTAEKMLRVCHAIAVFTALTTQDKQRLLWYCDYDAINEDAQNRRFEHTQKIFVHVLGMYCQHEFDIVGFGKSFAGKSHLDDLLSIPDLAAGVVQDLLQAHDTGSDAVPGGTEKEALIRWIATQGTFLSKITIQISELPSGELGSGLVQITPVRQAR